MAAVDVQVYQFFVMVLAGVALGVVYDVYRTFRLLAKPGVLSTAIYDLVFWVVATILVLCAVFYASWGEVRIYVFIGTVTGALLYFRLASHVVRRIIRGVFTTLVRMIRFIVRVFNLIVVQPLWFAVRVISRIISTLLLPFWAIAVVTQSGLRDAMRRRKPPTNGN